MIKGVSFSIPQGYSKVLWEILANINVVENTCVVIAEQTEVWPEKGSEDFFEKDVYNGDEFCNLIQSDVMNIIFLKLQIYFDKVDYSNIETYDDFANSACRLLILVYDCCEVEIYTKNKEDAIFLFQNAIQKKYCRVAFITEDDSRINLNIM